MLAQPFVLLAILPLSLSPLYSRTVQSGKPVVKRAIPAIYPPLAAVAEESGTVIVEVRVSPEGTVSEATAIDGHQLFRTAAERSARLWVFDSAAEHISRVIPLTFSFKFIKKPNGAEDLLPAFMPPYSVEIRSTTPQYVIDKNVDPPNSGAKPRTKTKHP